MSKSTSTSTSTSKSSPKVALMSGPMAYAIYGAAHSGDVQKLEALRQHVHPDVWLSNKTPGMSSDPFSLIDAALYLNIDGNAKNEEQLNATDLTVLWLLERAEELGVLKRTHENLSTHWNLLDKALLMLSSRVAVFLSSRGCTPYDVGPTSHGARSLIGGQIVEADVPGKAAMVESLGKALACAKVAGEARLALADIRSLRKELFL